MFSFHKPKIYRSILGCCICKAKSSSSRFTDSKKYENEFERCFKTNEKRTGEICNACVLLVKRWKKLPPGTQRDWRHVVDARAGPGSKSMKSSNGKPSGNTSLSFSGAHKRPSKPKKTTEDINADDAFGEASPAISRIPSPERSDSSDLEDEDDDYLVENPFQPTEPVSPSGRRKLRYPSKQSIGHNGPNFGQINGSPCGKRTAAKMAMRIMKNTSTISSFLDMTFWKKEKICCGIIFKGPDNEVVIYPKLLKPCSCRRNSLANSLEGKSEGSVSDNISVMSSSSSPIVEDDASSNASIEVNLPQVL
ncbi:hypothetical protein HDE_05113 [Halotydeus destructor]|nr:hypothetical protein HDE_05113 [Halotydeus destructor]